LHHIRQPWSIYGVNRLLSLSVPVLLGFWGMYWVIRLAVRHALTDRAERSRADEELALTPAKTATQ
jgi:hypothetical protein